jgi:hypothetical protein
MPIQLDFDEVSDERRGEGDCETTQIRTSAKMKMKMTSGTKKE